MRIGFDAKRVFHNFSGLGNYSRNSIQLLSKYYSNNDYFLYTPKPGNQNYNSNVKVILPQTTIHKKFSSFWRTFYLTKQLVQDGVDIFHGLSNELPKNIQKNSIPSVVTIHDLIFIRYPELYNPIDRLIYRKKFKYACDVADCVIAISEQTKEDIIHFFNIKEDKIKVVYQGCNSIYYEKASEKSKEVVRNKYKLPSNYILYVGTVEKRKNLLNIIKAVHQGNIDLPVVAVGRQTDYVIEVKKYIADNSIKNIYFTGSVDIEELPALYQMSDLFVYPSVFEGFGIPILEALNSGVPVITSTGSCFSEAGGESSIYVEPDNIDELIHAIRSTIFDTAKKSKIIEEGYLHANKFRENIIADNLINVYKSLLSK